MAQFKITVGDQSYGLTLPDGASQADIAAATDDFVKHVHSQGSAPPAAPAPAAAPPPAVAEPNTGFGNALGYGLHETAGGLGATAQVAGKAAGNTDLQSAGKAVEGAIGAPQGYQPTDIAGSLRSGDVMGAIKQIPRAAVEAGPDLAGTLAAARVGSALGPWGAAAGAGTYTAARMFGRNAQSAAQANHNEPEDNLGRAAAVTGGQAVLGVVGLGKAPGLSAAVESLPAVGRAVARTGLETASGAAQDALGQIGNTAGTVDGTKFDPVQSAAAGLQAGAARAAGEVLPVAKAGVKEASDQVLSRTVDQPQHLEDAKSIDRVAKAADAAQEANPSASRLQALNTVKTEHVTNIVETLIKLRDAGDISPQEYRTVRTAAETQAQRHNNTITEGGDNPSLYDAIDNLQKAPDDVVSGLKDAIRDLNTASTQSFAKNQTGPFQQIGTLLGKWGGVAGAAATGNIPELIAAGLGHSMTGKVGGLLGKGVDNVVGTNTPKVDLQAIAARRMLKDAGVDSGTSSVTQLQAIRTAMDDAASKVSGLDTLKKLAQAKVDKLAQTHAVNLAADGLAPTTRPGSDPTADAAAVAQTAVASDRTRAWANAAGPEVADRLAMGIPPVDPVAVDGLSPPRPQAPRSPSSQARPAPQSAAPAPTPQGAPTAPPAASSGPAFASFTPKSQAHHWVTTGMKRDVSHAEFTEALAALHEDGIYTTHEHNELRDQTGSVTNLREAIKPVLEVLRAKDAGRRAVGLPESALEPGDKGEPRSPTQYASGKSNYTALADGLISDAAAAGHSNVKLALRQIKAEPTTTGKNAIKASLLDDPDLAAAEKAFAAKTLTGKIMKGRDDRPPPAAAPQADRKPTSKAVEIARQKAATTAALKALVAKKGT